MLARFTPRLALSRLGMAITTIALLTQPVSAIEQDKKIHFGVSAGMAAACSTISNLLSDNRWLSSVACFLGVTAIGAAKEIIDPYQGGNRDIYDMYANMAGASAAVGTITLAFEFGPSFKPEIRPLANPSTPKIEDNVTHTENATQTLAVQDPLMEEGKTTRFSVVNGQIEETRVALKQ